MSLGKNKKYYIQKESEKFEYFDLYQEWDEWYEGFEDWDDSYHINYEYLPHSEQPDPTFYKGRKITNKTFSIRNGSLIDMQSFYPKDKKRSLKIDEILKDSDKFGNMEK